MVDQKQQILSLINKHNLRYELHEFPSKAYMIDIWKENQMYVLQINQESYGLSIVSEDPDFTSIPDQTYTDFDDFRKALESLIT